MPTIPDEFIPVRPVSPSQADPADGGTAGLLDTVKAAGIDYNWPYRAWRYIQNRNEVTSQPGYDPFVDIKGTRYETDPQRFAFSRSPQETQAIMKEWDDDDWAGNVLSKSGWTGTVAGIGMGLLDPTIFLPVAKVFSGAAAGANALRIGADTAIAGAIGSTIGESAMLATKPDYTIGDAAIGVGTGTVLSGLLGAGAGALLSSGERKVLEQGLHADRETWGADVAAGAGIPQSAGAAASETRDLTMRTIPGLNKLPDLTAKISPPRRVLTSPFLSARRATADLVETPYIFDQNLEGVATTQGPALDRSVKLVTGQGRIAMTKKFDELYTHYRFGSDGASWFQKKAASVRDLTGAAREKATSAEFREMVGDALRNGDAHEVPEAAEAAKWIRDNIFSYWRDKAIARQMLPEDVGVETADSYMMRVWNKDKLIANRPQAVKTFADWYGEQEGGKVALQDTIADHKAALDDLNTRIGELERKASAADDAAAQRQMADLLTARDDTRLRLEEAIGQWRGRSAGEAQSALRARAEAEAARSAAMQAGLYAGKGERLTSADAAVDRAVARILSKPRRTDRLELESLANETIDRIVSGPDGRLPYDAPSGGPRGGVPPLNPEARGPLAARTFMIPDNLVRDFLENDAHHIAELYLNTMVPDVLLTERFGDVNMTETFRRLNEEAAAKELAAPDEKTRLKIRKQKNAVEADLAAMRDRIRHTYGYSSDPRQRFMGRVAATAARYDIITNLGGSALSSLSDLAGLQIRYGMASTFKGAWKPMLKALVDPQTRKALGAYREQLQAMGIAAESYLASRTHGLYDVLDVYRPTSRFERDMNLMADQFGLASLLSPWTDFGKFAAGMVSGTEIGRAAEALSKGTATPRQIRDLAEGGIDAAMAERIHSALTAPGGSDVVAGIRIPNTGNWTDAEARAAFEGALSRDVDIMILTPGAEKPLMMSNPITALLLQYKTFVAAANERILVRGFQAHDARTLLGFASAIALGSLAEFAYTFAAGREGPKTPQDWIKAGIERSGILGWYQEGNSIAAKWTGGTADAFRLLGAGQPDARYISRSPAGALLGPTFGKAESTVKVFSKVIAKVLGGDVEWNANDTSQMRRMLAGQNLFYIRRLLDAGEDKVDEWMGIEPPDRSGGKH